MGVQTDHFPKWLPILHSISSVRRVPVFPQPQNVLFYLAFYYHRPNGYEVASHQDSVCISLMTKNSEHPHGYLCILFGEMSV